MQTERYDVAIVGGGLIGSTLALALDFHGLKVSLIDRLDEAVRTDPAFDGRAYAVAPGSANLLRVLGIWNEVAARAQRVQRITVGDSMRDPFPAALLTFDPGEVNQSELGWIVEDRWLRNAILHALADSSVDHVAPAQVADLTTNGATAEITLTSGVVLSARAAVASDGRRSVLGRSAGIDYLQWSYDQTGLVSAIAHELPHDGTAHQSFFPGGPFAVLPLGGNRSSLVWSERTERAEAIAALSDQAYLDAVRARIGSRLGEISLDGKRWAYPLNLALATCFAANRFAVVGDAAHGVHPIAGQGMNMGMRDIAALTEVLVRAARRGEDIGARDVLARYEQWRRFDATAMSLGMDGLNRMFSTASGPVQAIRNLGLGAVAGLGPARRAFMTMASGTGGDAPRLLKGMSV